MQKPLTLLLFGFGLIAISTTAAFAKTDALAVSFGSTPLVFNVNNSWNNPAEPTDRTVAGKGSLAAAGHQPQNDYATATLNVGSATLAGALTLLLIQRRRCADSVW